MHPPPTRTLLAKPAAEADETGISTRAANRPSVPTTIYHEDAGVTGGEKRDEELEEGGNRGKALLNCC